MAARALADKVVLLLQLLLSFPGWSQLVYVTQVHHLTNLHTQTTWSCTSSAHTRHLDTQTTINHPPTQNTHLYKPPTHINCQKQKQPTLPPKPTYPSKPLTCKNHPSIQTTCLYKSPTHPKYPCTQTLYLPKPPAYTTTKTTCLYKPLLYQCTPQHRNNPSTKTTNLYKPPTKPNHPPIQTITHKPPAYIPTISHKPPYTNHPSKSPRHINHQT